MQKNARTILAVLVAAVFIHGQSCDRGVRPDPLRDYEIASAWAEMALFITKNTPSNSPTYASRCFGYIGLTMYESAVHSSSEYQSLEGQLNGLEGLPIPKLSVQYDWKISFNAAQAAILQEIYRQTSGENKTKIDSLEKRILANLSWQINDKKIVDRSVDFGKAIADKIYQWSVDDGGHRAYLRNFDKDFVHPEFPGSWIPPLYSQSFSHHPLHPQWGENRTFLKENANLEVPYMIPYDTSHTSEYYRQFVKVYEKDMELTQEEKEIAIWWGDDPDETFTPPGHSFYIATMLVKDIQPSLIECGETFARVGLAVADAFINCWKWKYHFFSERPNTYIPEFIDERWESFWPDPPFPAFPSGHAIQAAAAATVLMDIYGNDHSFTDHSHTGRKRDDVRDVDFKSRPFSSVWGVAEETANSRFYGGIHTPQDNEAGLEKGARIAENVNNLRWKK